MNPTGLLGVAVLLGLAWLISENRRAFPLRLVIGGVVLQIILAVVLTTFPPAVAVFQFFAEGIATVIGLADAGIAFLFGPELLNPGGPWGFVFAVKVLPVIIYFASLMAVLYHIGIMPKIVAGLAWLLRRTLGVSGPEALAMAANVFVGQTEAPLCIKPYLDKMSRAGLMTLMVGGFATIAGSVLAGYVNFLTPMPAAADSAAAPEIIAAAQAAIDAARDQQALWIRHLLTASVMSAPAAFVMARVIVPESADNTGSPVEASSAEITAAHAIPAAELEPSANLLDAASAGATDGLKLALNVGAMLIAFVSLLALVNWPIQAMGEIIAHMYWPLRVQGVSHEIASSVAEFGIRGLDLQTILGWLFAPLAWTMGVEWADAALVGRLMGEKIVATEFIAFGTLAENVNQPGGGAISQRSAAIGAFALCGFANFGSIGIQIGGLSALAPSRRKDFVSLAFKAMIGGAFASWMTAAIAGVFL